MKTQRAPIGLAALALIATASAADLYKWTDEKGQVHYTSSSPPDTAKKPQQIDPANPSNAEALPDPALDPATLPMVATAAPTIGASATTAIPNALFVLDGSGSMWAKLGDKPKIDVAKTVLADMLNKLAPEVHTGLLVYGTHRKDDCNDIEMLAPLGSTHAALAQALNSVNPKGMTPLTGAIQLAAAQLQQVEGAASVVVVSDGKETCAGDPCAAAREAANAGMNLRIHVVGFDVAPDETQQLNCIAKEGKGKYFAANNAEQLVTALAEVRKEVAAPPPPPPPPVKVAQTPPPSPKPTEVLFEDHFDRNQLGEMWKVVNPDPNRLTISDGKLLVVGTKDDKNIVLVQQPFPGNFVVTVKMDSQVAERNWAGLRYWIDEKNYLSFGPEGYCCSKGRWPTFTKAISGEKNVIRLPDADQKRLGSRSLAGYATTSEIWYLQLERSGVKYIGRISVDGRDWMEIGTHTILQKNGRIGVSADSGGGTENTAEFSDFVVKGAK
ncbi:MAG: VWA domain-containing protein [Candidatus Competibacter sp.]